MLNIEYKHITKLLINDIFKIDISDDLSFQQLSCNFNYNDESLNNIKKFSIDYERHILSLISDELTKGLYDNIIADLIEDCNNRISIGTRKMKVNNIIGGTKIKNFEEYLSFQYPETLKFNNILYIRKEDYSKKHDDLIPFDNENIKDINYGSIHQWSKKKGITTYSYTIDSNYYKSYWSFNNEPEFLVFFNEPLFELFLPNEEHLYSKITKDETHQTVNNYSNVKTTIRYNHIVNYDNIKIFEFNE